MIPEAAVEAAMIAWLDRSKAPGSWSLEEEVRAALEAAAPHMLADIAAELEDAPPANYEEDNYDAGYAAGLAFALDSLGAAE